jgi:hypothetical protein
LRYDRVVQTTAKSVRKPGRSGRLRIGDDWNAITVIALSQSNPLKAVAEFVENSIDARARSVTITRGREQGEHYLLINDDGEGIPRDELGVPDFRYVATHICDSIKRRLKEQGAQGIQGEFGIGLLSFWTVGDELLLTSAGSDGKVYQMRMRKGDPNYTVSQRHMLFGHKGAELKIKPLLPGIRQFSGEKIQWYLASELRDRIRQSDVKVRIVDRQARREYKVEPRRFGGRLLHDLPRALAPGGEVYLELYLAEPDAENQVGLYRSGTRVLADITELEAFKRAPWDLSCLQGLLDAPFLNLTPGTQRRHPRCAVPGVLCRGGAGGRSGRRDPRGTAPGRGRASHARYLALYPARLPRSFARAARGRVRLVRYPRPRRRRGAAPSRRGGRRAS